MRPHTKRSAVILCADMAAADNALANSQVVATPSSGVGIMNIGATAHTATRTDDHSIASYHAVACTIDRAGCRLPSDCTGG